MDERKQEGITPYRMNQMMRTAADITERLVNGKSIYKPSYHECEIIIELVGEAIKKSKNEYRRK